ncbi:MAG: citrate synthase/methylcitrate synthase, partial [Candidatus Eisenbacteria bacterium]|nr:citrate synthase/methylcitrate synthase [Candidatus Eisenbacteria bacterium]
MTEERIRALITEAAERARRETDDEPEPGLVGDSSFPMQCTLNKGLEGAVATATKIGYVNGAKGWLIYRGINIFDLALHSTFEETTYLLLYGSLPTRRQLADFGRLLTHHRPVPPLAFEILERIPTARTHPMSALRTAVSVLGTMDDQAERLTVADETEVSIKLIAQMATLAGAVARLRHGRPILAPREDLGHAANLLYMMTGEEPDPRYARVMDISLILHADHGMNASTFTTMVVNSSMADMYGSVAAGIASLKGPLHGGANEMVLYDLEEIGRPENVPVWFERAQQAKRKVMGFGHRVYKAYDPRARILGPLAELLSQEDPKVRNLYEIAVQLDHAVTSKLGQEKKIFPNVDFYSGIVYRALGIETAMFTPIFAVSRVSGWTARALEYLGDNRIFRPRAVYTCLLYTSD